MKTREQLIEEIIQELGYGGDLTFETIPEIINKVVETCEETIKESPEWAFENLKKLKSR